VHHSGLVITELSQDDSVLFARTLARFRNAEVADAAGFLSDPATVVVVAVDNAGEMSGWAWGTRQRRD
jgi:hypothetical protein